MRKGGGSSEARAILHCKNNNNNDDPSTQILSGMTFVSYHVSRSASSATEALASTSSKAHSEQRTLVMPRLVPARPKGTNSAGDVRETTPLIGGLSLLIKMEARV